MRLLAALGLISTLLVACTIQSAPTDTAGSRVCAVEAKTPCTCADGKSGEMTCNADGTAYNACVCPCTPSCTGKTCGSDGCGGSCGECEDGFACSAASSCKLDPESLWDIMVTKGKMPTGSYANYTSLPDPYVCIKPAAGTSECTGYALDTEEPIWNETILTKVKASTLLLPMDTTVYDDDEPTDGPDALCSKKVTLTESDFLAGLFAVSCSGHSWEAKLIAGPR